MNNVLPFRKRSWAIALAIVPIVFGLSNLLLFSHHLLMAAGVLPPFALKVRNLGPDLLFVLLGAAALVRVAAPRHQLLPCVFAAPVFISGLIRLWQLTSASYLPDEGNYVVSFVWGITSTSLQPSIASALAFLASAMLLMLRRQAGPSRQQAVLRGVQMIIVLSSLISIAANLLDARELYAIVHYERLFMPTSVAIGMLLCALAAFASMPPPYQHQASHDVEGKLILKTGTVLLLMLGLTVGITALSTLARRNQADAVDLLNAKLRFQNELVETVLNEGIGHAVQIAHSATVMRSLEDLERGRNVDTALAQLSEEADSLWLRGYASIRLRTRHGRLIVQRGSPTTEPVQSVDLHVTVPAGLLWEDGFILRTRITVRNREGTELGTIESEKKLAKLTAAYLFDDAPQATFDALICGRSATQQVDCFPSHLNRHIVSLPSPGARTKLPIDYALDRESGVRTAVDYRGEHVIVSHAPIGLYNLAAIAKIDARELYAPIRQLIENLVYAIAGLMLIGTLLLHSRIRPLVDMLTRARETAKEATISALDREVRIRAVVDHIHDGVVTMNTDGIMLTMNPAGARMFGRQQSELVGQHFSCLLPPEHREAAQALFALYKALPADAPEKRRTVLAKGLHASGSIIYYELGTNQIAINGDDILIGIIRDVTQAHDNRKALEKSEETLRTITDNVPVLIGYVDREQRYQFVNYKYEEWFARPREEVLGKTAYELFGEKAYAIVEPRIRQVLQGETVKFEVTPLGPNYPAFAEVTYLPKKAPSGEVEGYYVLVVDTSHLKAIEAQWEKDHELLSAVLETIEVGVVACDQDGVLTLFNRATKALHGLPERPIPPELWSSYYSLFAEDGVTPLQQNDIPLFRALSGETIKDVPMVIRTPDAPLRHLHASGRQLYGNAGQALGAVVAMTDVTAIKAYERQLQQLARFDMLTGLANRAFFHEKLGDAIARSTRHGQVMALLYLDIDRFKAINDGYGHHAGDLVLRQFGDRLRLAVRKTDTVARLGGDEFVIILEGLRHAGEAETVAGKIIRAMDAPFAIESMSLQVATSIGVALRDDTETDADQLLQRADAALYEAKSGGRNQFRLAQFS